MQHIILNFDCCKASLKISETLKTILTMKSKLDFFFFVIYLDTKIKPVLIDKN